MTDESLSAEDIADAVSLDIAFSRVKNFERNCKAAVFGNGIFDDLTKAAPALAVADHLR